MEDSREDSAMSEVRDAYCFISIELNGKLACASPLAEISLALRTVADKIEEFEEDQNLSEIIIIRGNSRPGYRKKIGQADLDIQEKRNE